MKDLMIVEISLYKHKGTYRVWVWTLVTISRNLFYRTVLYYNIEYNNTFY